MPDNEECEFCGLQDPDVKKYADGNFHEDCYPLMTAYRVVRDAIYAMPVGLAESVEQLIRDDLEAKIEHDSEPITCEACGTVNRVLKGTDPGDYRCSKCTDWL